MYPLACAPYSQSKIFFTYDVTVVETFEFKVGKKNYSAMSRHWADEVLNGIAVSMTPRIQYSSIRELEFDWHFWNRKKTDVNVFTLQ
jgi:hypothetical protein